MPDLSQRQVNRAVLARQGLLEPLGSRLPKTLERIGGIQAQYAPSMYVGLWSRLEGFERDALTRALERRSVVQATLMRSTIHLVSRADFWPLALATRAARRTSWLRSVRDAPSEDELEAAARTLRERLGDGTLPRKEVEALLGKPVSRAVGLWLDLVRSPPSGTWERRRADLYGAARSAATRTGTMAMATQTPASRVVTLVLCRRDGTVLGALDPFEVEVPWWQEVALVVAGAQQRLRGQPGQEAGQQRGLVQVSDPHPRPPSRGVCARPRSGAVRPAVTLPA